MENLANSGSRELSSRILAEKAALFSKNRNDDRMDKEISWLVYQSISDNKDNIVDEALELLAKSYGIDSGEYTTLYEIAYLIGYRDLYKMDNQELFVIPFSIPFLAVTDYPVAEELPGFSLTNTIKWLVNENNLKSTLGIVDSRIRVISEIKSGYSEDYYSFSKTRGFLNDLRIYSDGALSRLSERAVQYANVTSLKLASVQKRSPASSTNKGVLVLQYAILGVMVCPAENEEDELLLLEREDLIGNFKYRKALEEHIIRDMRESLNIDTQSVIAIYMPSEGVPVDINHTLMFNDNILKELRNIQSGKISVPYPCNMEEIISRAGN